jgi:hypothetical protein
MWAKSSPWSQQAQSGVGAMGGQGIADYQFLQTGPQDAYEMRMGRTAHVFSEELRSKIQDWKRVNAAYADLQRSHVHGAEELAALQKSLAEMPLTCDLAVFHAATRRFLSGQAQHAQRAIKLRDAGYDLARLRGDAERLFSASFLVM